MQSVQAFEQMVSALSWPVNNIAQIAKWRTSVERVLGLVNAMDELDHTQPHKQAHQVNEELDYMQPHQHAHKVNIEKVKISVASSDNVTYGNFGVDRRSATRNKEAAIVGEHENVLRS
jgi:ABC-type uncharacterized transport system fused permease/ATPase subunit